MRENSIVAAVGSAGVDAVAAGLPQVDSHMAVTVFVMDNMVVVFGVNGDWRVCGFVLTKQQAVEQRTVRRKLWTDVRAPVSCV